jgi:prephenate dehydratase-like protein
MRNDSGPDAAMSAIRVAFQGELGAYGHEAIVLRWRSDAEPVPVRTFDDVIASVGSGDAQYGVIPVWNTIVGNIAAGCAAVSGTVRGAVSAGCSGTRVVAQVECDR